MSIVANFLCNINSENTKVSYSKDLHDFFAFRESQIAICDIDFKELCFERIIQFKDHLKNKGLSSSSINRKLIAVKSFSKWAINNRLITSDPFIGVNIPKPAVEAPTIAFTDDEVSKLLSKPNVNEFHGLVHYMVLNLLFNLGLRRSELCQIKLLDIYMDRGFKVLKIRGKGSKIRTVPLNENLDKALNVYLSTLKSQFNIHLNEQDYLIQSNQFVKNSKPISGTSIFRIVTRYAEELGIDKRVGAHSCRATFVSNLLENGVSIRDVANAVGHSNILTTTLYDKRRDNIQNSAALKVKY